MLHEKASQQQESRVVPPGNLWCIQTCLAGKNFIFDKFGNCGSDNRHIGKVENILLARDFRLERDVLHALGMREEYLSGTTILHVGSPKCNAHRFCFILLEATDAVTTW